jgi:hypothetical protein
MALALQAPEGFKKAGISMILYLAGNFPVMNDLEKEREMRRYVLKKGYPTYNRLVSFYHKKGAENVLTLNKGSRSRRKTTNKSD